MNHSIQNITGIGRHPLELRVTAYPTMIAMLCSVLDQDIVLTLLQLTQ